MTSPLDHRQPVPYEQATEHYCSHRRTYLIADSQSLYFILSTNQTKNSRSRAFQTDRQDKKELHSIHKPNTRLTSFLRQVTKAKQKINKNRGRGDRRRWRRTPLELALAENNNDRLRWARSIAVVPQERSPRTNNNRPPRGCEINHTMTAFKKKEAKTSKKSATARASDGVCVPGSVFGAAGNNNNNNSNHQCRKYLTTQKLCARTHQLH